VATYSQVTDLLTGDLTIGGGVNKDRYVQDATDEINSRIGFMYLLPLTPTPATHILLTLKRCANLIATGRMILALGVGGEDGSQHSYGESLLHEGQMLLSAIECGQISLGCDKIAVQGDGNAPTILQTDSLSSVDAFYGFVNGLTAPGLLGEPIWTPGQ
jgi:phage gp36-like protein